MWIRLESNAFSFAVCYNTDRNLLPFSLHHGLRARGNSLHSDIRSNCYTAFYCLNTNLFVCFPSLGRTLIKFTNREGCETEFIHGFTTFDFEKCIKH